MLRIGASSCLLGHRVRYDGGHKRHRSVTETLSRYFEIIAVCPEMEVGMGVPREPVDLIGDPCAPRMMGQRSGRDWSGIMQRHGRRRAAEMERLGICGFVLKKGSPSCGPDGVPVRARWGEGPATVGVHTPLAATPGTASGLFARALKDALPLLPVEAEDRLDDASLCENFIERVHAYREWRECAAEGPSVSRLMDFHASHKLTLLAHSESHLRLLGRLLADAGNDSPEDVTARYGRTFMEALKQPATRGTNTNALEHLAGFLSTRLNRHSRERLARLVHDYRLGRVPLSAPVALIRRHATEHRVDYVLRQSFLHAPATQDPQ
ncbi:MAG: DUF523 and DUF1722 domain-containing protein [Deltaproteobacteria bacterium]|nr:DUF523 and DUF1722 domain-containing protein [Deltaproteobacteria bacterium]